MNPLLYFWLFLKASLFSTGGFGNVPLLHDELIPRGWATEAQFVEAMAVGQVSPGPNGLWVVSFGYLTYGIRGALLALLALSLPPLLVLAVERLYRRVKEHPAVEGFVRGLALAVIGIFAIVLMRLVQSAGLNGRSLVILLGSLALSATRRVPVVVILGLAAVAGLLFP